MNIKYRLLCKRLIEEKKRVGVIQYYNVLFIMELVSDKDMLARLETMVLMGADIPLNAIRSQLAAGIDIMVHLARMPDKTRKVIEINEIQEFKDNQIILNKLYCMENGKLKKVGTLKNIFKLQSYGLSV